MFEWNWKRVTVLPALFLLLFLTNISCKKDAFTNTGYLPGDELTEYLTIDTLPLTAMTVREEKVRSNGFLASPLGAYIDPVFGKASASIITQLTIFEPNPILPFTSDIVIDSVNLYLTVDEIYGENEAQEINVYFVDETIDTLEYQSDYDWSINPIEIGKKTDVSFNRLDSLSIGGNKYAPGIRIPLYDLVGDYMLNHSRVSFESYSTYRNFIPGIKIEADYNTLNTNGGMATILLAGNSSFIRVFYSDSKDTTSGHFDFLFNGHNALHTQQFETDYTSTALETAFDNPVAAEDFLYIQSMAGCYVSFEFPNLDKLVARNNVILHKAELVLPVENDKSLPYAPHDKLFVALVDNEGVERVTLDQAEGADHYGGSYDFDDHSYRFNLTRSFQNILNTYGTDSIPNTKFHIIPGDDRAGGAAVSPNRTILAGTNNATLDRQFKMIFSFTPLKK